MLDNALNLGVFGFFLGWLANKIQKKMNRVVFKGNAEEVLSYLSEKSIN
jgi:hypothetical protein